MKDNITASIHKTKLSRKANAENNCPSIYTLNLLTMWSLKYRGFGICCLSGLAGSGGKPGGGGGMLFNRGCVKLINSSSSSCLLCCWCRECWQGVVKIQGTDVCQVVV